MGLVCLTGFHCWSFVGHVDNSHLVVGWLSDRISRVLLQCPRPSCKVLPLATSTALCTRMSRLGCTFVPRKGAWVFVYYISWMQCRVSVGLCALRLLTPTNPFFQFENNVQHVCASVLTYLLYFWCVCLYFGCCCGGTIGTTLVSLESRTSTRTKALTVGSKGLFVDMVAVTKTTNRPM